VSEFMFRNLSVKLFPAETASAGIGAMQAIFQCLPCSQPPSLVYACTQTPTWVLVGPTGGFPGCGGGTSETVFGNNGGVVVLPAFQAGSHEQLAQLKSELQRSLDAVDAQRQHLEQAAQPKSVEEIDNLKAQLLGAVAELDEQRARMTGGQPPTSG
jgi:hypothetical protein